MADCARHKAETVTWSQYTEAILHEFRKDGSEQKRIAA
jgi:hypothetical protein